MNKDFKIDFIGIGFPRCGTTWISKCLEEHPDICFSNKKEVQFFNNDYDYKKGLDYYKSFFDCDKEKVIGEFTPEYFMYKKTFERIREDFPNVKLIFSLRNPVERAFSHYLYRKRKTGNNYPIEEIFSQGDIPLEEQILFHGFYYNYLSKWIKDLPSDQYLILIHDDYKKNPTAFIQKIYQFLGVDSDFIAPSVGVDVNKSKGLQYHSRLIQNIYAYRTKIKKNIWGRKVVELLKVLGLSKVIEIIISKNFKGGSEEKEVLSSDIRKKIREVYNEDIRELENLLHRNLSFWK